MDLSVTTQGGSPGKDGKMSDKVKESGTYMQQVTVTNNDPTETATGVMVGTSLQAGMDVREAGQTMTEFGTPWGITPTTTDTSGGTVTVNDIPMAGMDLKEMDLESMPSGEMIWRLGTPLAPGESATMTFGSQLSPIKADGTDAVQTAQLMAVDQGDVNPLNDFAFANFRFGTPLVLDIDGDGIETLSIDEGVEFDILDTGTEVQTGWVSGDDALLAIDNNGNGQIDKRSELFGGGVGEGFAKLANFDSNDDGVVDASDVGFSALQVWQDANEDGVTDEGELVSLESTDITSLNTDYTDVFSTDAQGNVLGEHSSATLADGSAIDLVDVYFEVEA